MPIPNPGLLSTGSDVTSSTSQTLSTFSPTGGRTMILSFVARGASAALNPVLTSTSIVDTFTGTGAWTEIAAHAETTLQSPSYIMAFAKLGASPGTGTIRIDFANSTAVAKAWVVGEFDGESSGSPLSESTSGESTSPNIRTIVDVVSGNLVLSGIGVISSGLTADTDFTGLGSALSGGTSPVFTAIAYDPNDNQTSGTFTYIGGLQSWFILAEFAQSTQVTSIGGTSIVASTNKGQRARTKLGG